MHNACAVKDNDEVIGLLLAAKADVNFKRTDIGYTALHYASLNNAGLSVVTKLVEAGAHVNAVDKLNNTALHLLTLSIETGEKMRIAIVDYLHTHGAQPSLSMKPTG